MEIRGMIQWNRCQKEMHIVHSIPNANANANFFESLNVARASNYFLINL